MVIIERRRLRIPDVLSILGLPAVPASISASISAFIPASSGVLQAFCGMISALTSGARHASNT
jgi:hypothetical protein